MHEGNLVIIAVISTVVTVVSTVTRIAAAVNSAGRLRFSMTTNTINQAWFLDYSKHIERGRTV